MITIKIPRKDSAITVVLKVKMSQLFEMVMINAFRLCLGLFPLFNRPFDRFVVIG